ncbi:hypothetical protein HX823_07070 [Pseudomonas sp. P7759]|uniref:hypothetical protein n=1 Tax=Pseudomonas sp. P7759 TaxID=2738831 RepID=UPI0015A2EF70|nr:hypothetical protein [Pseudomonas sp. P7759]NWC73841.1 hypothetical protein [Pseudomonas sp. P7759]
MELQEDNVKAQSLGDWKALLANKEALLTQPGAHHAMLLKRAYGLHQVQLINRDELADLLDLADSALEYAFEELLHIPVENR